MSLAKAKPMAWREKNCWRTEEREYSEVDLILHWLPFRIGTNLQNFQFWPKKSWNCHYLWHRSPLLNGFQKILLSCFLTSTTICLVLACLYWNNSRYRYSEGLFLTRIDCLEFLCWVDLLCCNTFKIYEELLIIPVSKKKIGWGAGKGWEGNLRGMKQEVWLKTWIQFVSKVHSRKYSN